MEELIKHLKLWAAKKFGIKIRMTGILYSYNLTWGGAGNQWTTIGDETYGTYWNIHTTDWKTGDKVSFVAFWEPLPGQRVAVWQAEDIHRIEK